MQGVALRAKPNAAGCGQGVAAFYRPAVSVCHQIIGWLRERRREDGLHFMRGKEEEVTTLWMLDSTTRGRATGSRAEQRRPAGRRRLGLRSEEEEGQLGLGWVKRRNWAEWPGDLGRLEREWAQAC
jgi:hypothetical protein